MITIKEIKQHAKETMDICRMCRSCNGEACRGETPGPGGKGSGTTFVRNVSMWKQVAIHLDAIHDDFDVSTQVQLFGQTMAAPIFAAPIGAVVMNYGSEMEEQEYCSHLVKGCADANLLAFLGDGAAKDIFDAPLVALKEHGGKGICTIKPWETSVAMEKINRALACQPVALAMDVDASGLVHLKHTPTPIVFKTVEDLRALKEAISCPFIIKGIMSVDGAKKALAAGADAIVVSNHGGRVLDDGLSTVEVLEEIATFVDRRMTVLVDGGIRSGGDVFKALALGADGVLIGRPFSHAAFGGGSEGVFVYAKSIMEELKEAMRLSNCRNIQNITRDKVKMLAK